MSLIPNTVCRRCHREYPVIRTRCPYCGTKKPQEVRSATPESDSAVSGTEASRRAAENVNWQMLIGGILLVCVIVAVIALVSVNVKTRVGEAEKAQQEAIEQIQAETTAVPIPTATPTPSPTPTPPVTAVQITYQGREMVDFTESAGTQIDLDAAPYPLNDSVTISWTSSDDSVATVDENGLVTLVGASGSNCTVYATAGGVQAGCIVRVR